LDDDGNSLLYPRFLQLIIPNQLTTIKTHRGTFYATSL
jgi:hypothetical protein